MTLQKDRVEGVKHLRKNLSKPEKHKKYISSAKERYNVYQIVFLTNFASKKL